MKKFSKQNLLISSPVLLVMILDFIFTLAGQPAAYWENHLFYNEAGPLGAWFLLRGPEYFILFAFSYLLFALFLMAFLKKPFNIIIAIVFYLGHFWGSSSWLDNMFGGGYYSAASSWFLVLGYVVCIAIISGIFINEWLREFRKK